ncbi:MAG: hypothetical protein HGN29_08970 [Asgard group archaeon]|nr:hypothetical protein [Asgard group archaeon]
MKKKLSKKEYITLTISIIVIIGALSIILSVNFSRNTPYPVVLIHDTTISDAGTGSFLVNISVLAMNSELIFNGSFFLSPQVAFIKVNSSLPLSIPDGEMKQILITGSFSLSIEYTLTLFFIARESTISNIVVFTPSNEF